MRNGLLLANAFLDDRTELPWRWISAFSFDGYPSTWVEAKGVRYHMRTPGLTPRKRTERQLAAVDERRPRRVFNLAPPNPMHKCASMRTTIDLPDNVAAVLRRESARRGGRAKAPMVRLISDAVLVAYGRSKPAGKAQLVVKAGRGLVRMPAGIVITSEEVANALEEA